MLVVEHGVAVALADSAWLEVLTRIAHGEIVDVSAYGAEVGPVLGDAADLCRVPLQPVPVAVPGDPYAELVVIEDGDAVSLSPAAWLTYLEDCVSGRQSALADYGPSLGPVGPSPCDIAPLAARRILARMDETVSARAAVAA